MVWGKGLCVTTTGLDKHDKDAIREDIELAGGRYSPNLSKRTTHLVTPEVVSCVTEKLAAAAAGPGQQQRFKALQIVSKCWVSASAGLQRKAEETQFAPLLPPPAALTSTTQAYGGTDPAQLSAASAAAGPQTPWVVHFSQLPDDSVYASAASHQQQPESPSAAQQLAHQLHLRLSPISEAYSQEHSTPAHHSALAGPPAGPPDSGRLPAAAYTWEQQGQAAPQHVNAPWQQQVAANPCEEWSRLTPGSSSFPAPSAAQHNAWGAGHEEEMSPRGRSRPPALQLPANRSSSGSCLDASLAGSVAVGTLGTTAQQHEQQQQQQYGLLGQQAPTSSPFRGLQRFSTQGYSSSLTSAAAAAAALAEKSRRATADAQHLHHRQHQPLLQPSPPQPQPPQQQQQQPSPGWPLPQQDPQPQQQWQHDAAAGDGPPGRSGSSVVELIAALQRATADSRRGTAESAAISSAAHAGAPALTTSSNSSQRRRSSAGQHGSWLTAADQVPAHSTYSSADGGTGSAGSIEGLLQSLRQLNNDRTACESGQQAAAATPERPMHPPAAAGTGSPLQLAASLSRSGQDPQCGGQFDRQPAGPSSFTEHWQQQETQPQPQPQQRPEAFYWGSGGGHSSNEGAAMQGSTGTTAGGAASAGQGLSPLDLGQLLGMLHTATGDSRRATAEAATELCTSSSVRALGTGTAAGGGQAVADAAAVPLPLSQETATGHMSNVGAGWAGGIIAGGSYAMQATAQPPQQLSPLHMPCQETQYQERQQPSSGSAGGGYTSVAELVAALRRATGESRRNTAEAAAAAAAELPVVAAPAGPDTVDTGGFDAKSGTRDAGRAHKPQLTLKLPHETDSCYRDPAPVTGSMAGGSSRSQSTAYTTNSSSNGGTSSSIAASSRHDEEPESIAGLINALQCIAAASKLQEAAALAPEVAAVAATHVAALESQVESVPGSEYAQLVSRLSLELSELNKQGLRSLQAEQQQQGDGGCSEGLFGSMQLSPAAAMMGVTAGAVGSMSSGSQGLQQLVDALRKVTTPSGEPDAGAAGATAAAATAAAVAAPAMPGWQLEGRLQPVGAPPQQQLLPEEPTAALQQQEQQQVTAQQRLYHSPQHPHQVMQQQQQQQQQTPGSALVSKAYDAGGYGSLEDLVSALQAVSSRPAPAASPATPPAASGPAASAAVQSGGQPVECLLGTPQRQQQQHRQEGPINSDGAAGPTGSSNVHDLIAALRRVTAGSSRREVTPAAAAATAAAAGDCGFEAQGAGASAHQGTSSSVEELLQQLSHAAGQQQQEQQQEHQPQRASVADSDPGAVGGAGAGAAVAATLQDGAGFAGSVAGATAVQQAQGGQVQHASPAALEAGSGVGTDNAPAVVVAYTGSAADMAAAAANSKHEQRPQKQHKQEQAGDRHTAGAPTDESGRRTQSSLTEPAAVQGGAEYRGASQPLPGQHSLVGAAAAAGADLSDLAVVFERQIPAETRQKVSEALTACGATVLPGAPYLGCGANTIVAEPEAAAGWLPLLLDIVTPAWVTRVAKAIKQQQQQQGDAQSQEAAGMQAVVPVQSQHVVRLSPDIARAISLQLQHASSAAAAAVSSRRASAASHAPSATHSSNGTAQLEGPLAAAGQGVPQLTGGVAQMAAGSADRVLGNWGSSVSSSHGTKELPELVIPEGFVATSVGCNMPVLLQEAGPGGLQHQLMMMPAVLLTDQLWSVGQHPGIVAEEELEAVVLPGSVSSAITLLVPQSSTSLLGHAAISCPAADPAKGLTCGDVLAAIHGFYQQDVVLKPLCMQQDSAGATSACQTGSQQSPGAARGCQDSEELTGHGAGCGAGRSEQQQGSHTGPAEAAGAKWAGRGGVQMIKRLQLLGHRQMFEGLFRVTRDPCSTVYEVCLA